MTAEGTQVTMMILLGSFALTLPVWALVARKIVHRNFWFPWKRAEAGVDFAPRSITGNGREVLFCSVMMDGPVVEAERDVRRWLW